MLKQWMLVSKEHCKEAQKCEYINCQNMLSDTHRTVVQEYSQFMTEVETYRKKCKSIQCW